MAELADRAGDVYKEVYELTAKHMHPEDAADLASDAVAAYLESIGVTRPVSETYEGMIVKVSNVGQIKKALVEGVFEALAGDKGADVVDRHLSPVIKMAREINGGRKPGPTPKTPGRVPGGDAV